MVGFPEGTEHFVTLLDRNFLPAVLCLRRSLIEHSTRPAHLWIACLDDVVLGQLQELALPGVSLIRLEDVETAELRAVKPGRTVSEYCWTLSSFLPIFVFDRDPAITRVTYVDGDLFFFDDPRLLIEEFAASGAHVLLTEHAYAPRYDRRAKAGTYCVQFMTFRNTAESRAMLSWWQQRVLEWCFARYEDGKFGDQKYLEDWPTRFGAHVHVLRQRERTLAPWNASHFLDRDGAARPVFFHFHGFRVLSASRMRWYMGYRVGERAIPLYASYVEAMKAEMSRIFSRFGGVPTVPDRPSLRQWIRRHFYGLYGAVRHSSYVVDGKP